MTARMPERRRAVRATLLPPPACAVGLTLPARVLEVSVSGVLIGSRQALPVGERVSLRTAVGERALDVVIEIRGVSQEMQPRGGLLYRMSAAFVDPTAEQRLLLQELLGVERN